MINVSHGRIIYYYAASFLDAAFFYDVSKLRETFLKDFLKTFR